MSNKLGQIQLAKREMLKFKCSICGRFSVINAIKINPFLGKIIELKCGNPFCNVKLKINVPNN
jgi:hypothetical protein